MIINKKVIIILVNWNGWVDTIRCLESLFRLNYSNFNVIICDNNSTDNSYNNIKAWASGDLDLLNSSNDSLYHLTFPPVTKPIPIIECPNNSLQANINKNIILLQSRTNIGFAGGVNLGLQLAKKNDIAYSWILNNDVVVTPNSLLTLVKRLDKEGDKGGICGSTVYYYDEPDKIQTTGGIKYNRWFGITTFLKNSGLDNHKIESNLDAIYGASMLVSKSFLEHVGFLSEKYFLYFEELDWAIRGKMKNFKICYASDSIIYHLGGRSTGSTERYENNKSYFSDYYFMRNKLLFTKKFFPYAVPTILFSFILSIFNRIRRKQWKRVWMIFKIMIEFLSININFYEDVDDKTKKDLFIK